MDPFKQLTRLLEERMAKLAESAVMGVPCELGTITSTGLKLDNFKHEIRDYYVAEWTVTLELPQASRVVKLATPVNPDGSDIPGSTTYSPLTRVDFSVSGAEGPHQTIKCTLKLKGNLKPGDRVLAIPVNQGRDAVVIARVVR